jgi:hypothetical protein
MGISNEEAARRKKEKDENEKKKVKERKAVIATQKLEAKQRKMLKPFLIFLFFSARAPFSVQIVQQEQKARLALQTKKWRRV